MGVPMLNSTVNVIHIGCSLGYELLKDAEIFNDARLRDGRSDGGSDQVGRGGGKFGSLSLSEHYFSAMRSIMIEDERSADPGHLYPSQARSRYLYAPQRVTDFLEDKLIRGQSRYEGVYVEDENKIIDGVGASKSDFGTEPIVRAFCIDPSSNHMRLVDETWDFIKRRLERKDLHQGVELKIFQLAVEAADLKTMMERSSIFKDKGLGKELQETNNSVTTTFPVRETLRPFVRRESSNIFC